MKTLPILLTLAAACSPAVLMSAPGASQLSLYLTGDAAAKKDDLYRAGQQDLDASRWTAAIDKFSQVARKGGSDADGALYWKAYAESKAGRAQQALSTLRQLAGAYPKSSWIDDAKALEMEVRSRSGNGSAPGAKAAESAKTADEDEELKLYALNGILGSDPNRALPMLQKFLQGKHSQRLKEQALFVISQCDVPEARTTLLAVARGSAHPELQLKAVEYLGLAQGEEYIRTLDEIYRAASRPEVKRAVLNAYLVSSQRSRIFAVAQDAKDPYRVNAINILGSLSAYRELRQLYQSDPGVRMRVLEALGAAGDVDSLVDIARREQDPALRRKAIEGLGVGGGTKGAEALRAMYTASADPSIRQAVVEALFIQGNAHALIGIFRTEKDREIKRNIVQRLSMMDGPEASQFLEKLYSN